MSHILTSRARSNRRRLGRPLQIMTAIGTIAALGALLAAMRAWQNPLVLLLALAIVTGIAKTGTA